MLADDLLDLPGVRLLAVERLDPDRRHRDGLLRLRVETAPPDLVACPGCGVLAAAHGRLEHRLADAPCFATPVQIVWRKRRWRCREAHCAVSTWTEELPGLPARAKLTTRAIDWAVRTLRWDDSTVAAIARHLGVDWHTLMDAIREHTTDPDTGSLDSGTARRQRLAGVNTLGVDEHIWKHVARHQDRAVTSIVDLTRDEHGDVPGVGVLTAEDVVKV